MTTGANSAGNAARGDLVADTTRFRALDGVRGLAILLVVIHNSGAVSGERSGAALKLWAMFSNAGWVGVQLFFALSGFLITRILLDSGGAPGALRSFYARRFLRIVPLYYAVLAFVFFVVPHVPSLSALADTGTHSQFWYWTYLTNWLTPFGGMAAALPHIWSLAVEEQFYLLWPLIIARFNGRSLVTVCVALVASSLAARAVLYVLVAPEEARYAAYTFTATRWDAIAVGALVAVLLRDARATVAITAKLPVALATTVGALLIATAINRGLPAQGRLTEMFALPVSAMASALIVLACVSDVPVARTADRLRRTVRRALSARWLAWIGKYSYGIYLFHLPVHIVMQRRVPADALTIGNANARLVMLLVYVGGVFAISAALAVASWTLIERPALSLKRYFPMPQPQ